MQNGMFLETGCFGRAAIPPLSDHGGWVSKTSVLGSLESYYEKAFSIPFFTRIFVPKQVPK